MTEINFFDSAEAPQPRDAIRVEDLRLEPYSDGRRVKAALQITRFGPTDRPSLNILVRSEEGKEVAAMSVIETIDPNLTLTIHLRGEEVPQGTYEVEVQLYYEEPDRVQDTATANFTLPLEEG